MPRTSDLTPAVDGLAGLLTAALLTGILRGYQFSTIHGGGLFVDRYWAQYYLLNFADGFHHRALVGTLLRAVFPGGVSVLVINAIAIAAMALMLTLLLREVTGFVRQQTEPLRVLAAVVLLSSCMVGVLAETLGDLLHLCFAVVVFAFVLCLRIPSRAVAALCAVGAAAICLYVHEASILLLVPALLLAVCRGRVRVVAGVAGAVVLLLLLAWNSAHSNLGAQLTYAAHTFPHRGSLAVDREIYKGFRELRQEDSELFFSTLRRRLLWVARFGSVFLPAGAAVVAVSYLMPPERFRRFFTILCWLLAVSLPVYVLAHDWPRFLTLTLLLSFFTEGALHRQELPVELPLAAMLRSCSERFRQWSRPLGAAIAAALLLQLAASVDYRYRGMPVHVLLALVPILLGCMVWSQRRSMLL